MTLGFLPDLLDLCGGIGDGAEVAADNGRGCVADALVLRLTGQLEDNFQRAACRVGAANFL